MDNMQLNQEEIQRIIPHRAPMLLIDEVEELVWEKSIRAKFYVEPEREIFKGHFPEAPVLPGVYTVECMAQASDILLLSCPRYQGKVPYFIGIDKVRFMKKIQPGDTVEIRAEIIEEKKEKAIATCKAVVTNKGEVAATGEVTLAMR